MSLINTVLQNVKEHPFTSGMMASITGIASAVFGVLSDKEVLTFIGSIGGLLGIVLTALSIYYKIKIQNLKTKP